MMEMSEEEHWEALSEHNREDIKRAIQEIQKES